MYTYIKDIKNGYNNLGDLFLIIYQENSLMNLKIV